ncbi:tumor necrosis factor receptor superfamily member 9-like [Salvelinus namaycush]|uniref:Tumor necrosis factor receptor superfamily member 9-like n=1 Tax=Salvelinus namaycush TaxID=8040 RepID=A0A8U1BTC0_SALNM|nr:tumor necrosis factor receptor superfamily member 9-like [Salvelinus namaycush]
MHLVLRVLCFSLLIPGCLSSTGNRLVTPCGPDPKKLCVPCGAQTLKKACTRSKDTECDCKAGLRCGDGHCSFCVQECGKGQEPLPAARSCQNCPVGTFSDQIHEKCKPWRTSCPHPNEHIVALGDAVSDSKCGITNNSIPQVITLPTKRGSEDGTGLVWAITASCGVFIILIILFLVIIINNIKKKPEKTTRNEPNLIVPTPPTDEPRSLIDVSFHHPQQEQGSSSETLHSQDSETKLLPV